MKIKIFGTPILKGNYILYREEKSQTATMTPARMQCDYQAMIAICDVTGIQPAQNGQTARIICGPVKWVDTSKLKICLVSEDDLLSAPTLEGVR